jgi:hypothetical protein
MSNKLTDISKWPTLELTCVKCDEVKIIPQKLKHRTNVCLDCQRAQQRSYARLEAERDGRRPGVMGRLPYPLGDWDYYQQKFYARRSIMSKIEDREEWIKEIKKNLKETVENEELMAWINSHKDDDKPKKQTKINKQFPDTRGMTWEEYQRGLGEDDVDS